MTLNQQGPPHGSSLLWLNRLMRWLTWVTVFMTVGSILFYVSLLFRNSYYSPSFGNLLVSLCAILAVGGIVALGFMGLAKLTEIWAEVIDSGHHKTTLLETLLTVPVEHEENEP